MDEPQDLYMDVETVKSSNFKGDRETRFIIHGWQNNGSSSVNMISKKSLLERADVNVIVVDWGAEASTLNYLKARYVRNFSLILALKY